MGPNLAVELSMVDSWHHQRVVSFLTVSALILGGCASPSPTSSPAPSSDTSTPPSVAAATSTPVASESAAAATQSAAPTASSDFAFAADDVIAYYASQGYSCTRSKPSTIAAGYSFRTCTRVDAAGRALTIGVVTDPGGDLGDGFASVQGKDGEAILAPVDALDSLSGFLGAMLGEKQGAGLLEWLAGHLGDVYDKTKVGPLKVATYTESDTDLSKLFVELANDAYLTAEAP